MAQSGLVESFLGAIQASLSILLVIFYGGIAAKLKILTTDNTKAISKICVRMFLPALLLTKIGSELQTGSVSRYGIIFVWALVVHAISFLLGIFGSRVLKMPDWTTVAIMFNNSTSYPLLLIEALSETGILQSLIVADESTKDAVERAKSYFLIFSTVSSCLTFAIGPRLIDGEHAPEEDPDDKDEGTDGEDNDDPEANEQTNLLHRRPSYDPFRSNTFLGSIHSPSDILPAAKAVRRRASFVSKEKWNSLSPRTQWWLLFAADFFNAPLLGALLGAVIGLTPPLHKAFFAESQEGGIFTAWLTKSLKTVGDVFVPLPIVVAGVSLFSSMAKAKMDGSTMKDIPWGTWGYILGIRFILWPVASIGLVYAVASKTAWLGDDPMLWFTLMLMPTGPPAMKLITLVQVAGGSEEESSNISRLLTVSLFVVPLVWMVC
jgi:predicted permease